MPGHFGNRFTNCGVSEERVLEDRAVLPEHGVEIPLVAAFKDLGLVVVEVVSGQLPVVGVRPCSGSLACIHSAGANHLLLDGGAETFCHLANANHWHVRRNILDKRSGAEEHIDPADLVQFLPNGGRHLRADTLGDFVIDPLVSALLSEVRGLNKLRLFRRKFRLPVEALVPCLLVDAVKRFLDGLERSIGVCISEDPCRLPKLASRSKFNRDIGENDSCRLDVALPGQIIRNHPGEGNHLGSKFSACLCFRKCSDYGVPRFLRVGIEDSPCLFQSLSVCLLAVCAGVFLETLPDGFLHVVVGGDILTETAIHNRAAPICAVNCPRARVLEPGIAVVCVHRGGGGRLSRLIDRGFLRLCCTHGRRVEV